MASAAAALPLDPLTVFPVLASPQHTLHPTTIISSTPTSVLQFAGLMNTPNQSQSISHYTPAAPISTTRAPPAVSTAPIDLLNLARAAAATVANPQYSHASAPTATSVFQQMCNNVRNDNGARNSTSSSSSHEITARASAAAANLQTLATQLAAAVGSGTPDAALLQAAAANVMDLTSQMLASSAPLLIPSALQQQQSGMSPLSMADMPQLRIAYPPTTTTTIPSPLPEGHHHHRHHGHGLGPLPPSIGISRSSLLSSSASSYSSRYTAAAAVAAAAAAATSSSMMFSGGTTKCGGLDSIS